MNVLLLEDRGAITITLKPLIERIGHIVHKAYNPADADALIIGEEYGIIDAIILDLNLPTDGLDQETEIPETNKGVFSGWVWFTKHCLPARSSMLQRTVIYSAYVEDLRQHLERKQNQEELQLLNQMHVVRKREGSESPAEELLNSLEVIWQESRGVRE